MSEQKDKKILFIDFIKKADLNDQPFLNKKLPVETENLHGRLLNIINNYESSIINRERCHLMSSDNIDLI